MQKRSFRIPESLRYMSVIPGIKKSLSEDFSLSAGDFINKSAKEDIMRRLDLSRFPVLTDIVARNFFIKKILENPDQELLLKSLIEESKAMNLLIKMGNRCGHECKDYCMMKGNPDGDSIRLEDYISFLDKFGPWLKYIGNLHFIGQEFLLMDDFDKYLEEALKRGITDFSIVTRGAGSRKDNTSALERITDLKIRYPEFTMSLTTSLDRYSTLNSKDHKAMLRNLYDIMRMHLYLFGGDTAYVQSTGSVKRENEKLEVRYDDIRDITKDMNSILSLMEKDGVSHIKTEFEPSTTILTMSDGKKISLSLSMRNNAYDEPHLRDMAVNSNESLGARCEIINNPFNVFLDKDMNLMTCLGFHGMFHHQENRLVNTLSATNEEVLRIFMETKRRAFGIFEYPEFAEYLCKPKGIEVCNKL